MKVLKRLNWVFAWMCIACMFGIVPAALMGQWELVARLVVAGVPLGLCVQAIERVQV